MPKFLKVLFLVLFILLRFPSLVFAEFRLFDAIEEFGEKRYVKPQSPARLKAGPVRVHPSLRSRAAYDSNILQQDEDAREDIVFNVRPGATLELPIDKHQLAVGYEADFENFVKSRHADQNDQNQNAFALLDLNFPSFYINVLDKFLETSSRSGTTFTERIPRFENTINPKAGYRWKRFILETGYHHFVRDFRRQIHDSLDFQINEWNTVLYYDLFARLKALLDYQLARINYEDNASRKGTIHQFRVGLDGEIMPHLVLKARTGMQSRNYGASAQTDFNSWVLAMSAEYAMRQNLRFKASFHRTPIEATFQEVNYFLRHSFGMGVEYDFHPRWTVFTGAKFYKDHYSERATSQNMNGFRRDKHVGSEIGLRYSPREWLELELAYEYLHRTSNFPGLDFNDNVVYLSTSLVY